VHTLSVDDDELLAAARQILAETNQTDVQMKLGGLLEAVGAASSDAERQRLIDEIIELLCADEGTRWRLDDRLPGLTSETRERPGGSELDGDPELAFDRWACPAGDYMWPVLDVADDDPAPATCPNDGSPLVFRSAVE
jgi:hypothetical protein